MNDGPTTPSQSTEAAKQLADRPTFEDAEQQLLAVITDIATAATTLIPDLTWEWHRDRKSGGCGKPFDKTDGQEVLTQHYVASRPISDTVWPQFLAEARKIAARIGATTAQTFVNKPGDHDVWLINDSDQTTVKIGSKGQAVLAAHTGCNLPRAKMPPPK